MFATCENANAFLIETATPGPRLLFCLLLDVRAVCVLVPRTRRQAHLVRSRGHQPSQQKPIPKPILKATTAATTKPKATKNFSMHEFKGIILCEHQTIVAPLSVVTNTVENILSLGKSMMN